MKRQDWLIVFVPLVAIWVVDRLTKIWAVASIKAPVNLGWLHFDLHRNPGIMLSYFSDLPDYLRIVSLSTFGALLVCIYALIQFLLPITTLKLRVGLSIVLGGIMGNVVDRILWGYVIDFIVLGTGTISTAVFNVADAVQWVGYALILTAVFKEGDLIWPQNNARKNYWIDRAFQLKYCAILMGVGLGISLVTMVFSYTYLRVTMITLIGLNEPMLHKYLLPFAAVFSLICIGLSLGLFTVGKVVSHKMVGPLFAFERHVNEMIKNLDQVKDMKNLQFRTKDEFKHLELLAKQIQTTFQSLRHPGEEPKSESEATVKAAE